MLNEMTKSPTLTLVSCHFGDHFWINTAVSKYLETDINNLIKKILISDQQTSGSGQIFPPLNLLANTEIPIEIIQTKFNNSNHASFQHGYAIMTLLKSGKINTTHVLLTDSDCFPVNAIWNDEIKNTLGSYNAVCALQDNSSCLTHPCFMILPTTSLPYLDFMRNMTIDHDFWVDTGRLIGLDLLNLGLKVKFLKPIRLFRNKSQEMFYQNRSILHIGSASFRERTEANDQRNGSRLDMRFLFSRYMVENNIHLYSKMNKCNLFFVNVIWKSLFIRSKLVDLRTISKQVLRTGK